jgi:hypothetical protein
MATRVLFPISETTERRNRQGTSDDRNRMATLYRENHNLLISL